MRRFLRIGLTMLAVVVASLVSIAGISWWRSRPQEEPPQRRALRAEVLGCYALFGENGRIDTTYYNASPLVRLDSGAPRQANDSSPWHPRSLTALDSLGAPSRTTRGMWAPDWSADSLTDTVRISFSNGFSGAVFVLSAPPGSDTLRGRAYESWDVGPSITRRGAAHAVRVRCSAA